MNVARYNFDSGRYIVELEDSGGGTSLESRSHNEGTVVTQELHELSWGNGHRLKIVDGYLSVDGVSRGKLTPGNTIVVKANGDVLVDGDRR